jgi:hypothetical protein
MSSALPSLGQILSSHATSGVSANVSAPQSLSKLAKGIHASGQAANQTQFSAVFDGVRKAANSSAATAQIEKS